MGKCIVFDIDGVLADFVAGFTKEAGCVPPQGTVEYAGSWNFEEYIDRKTFSATWDKINKSKIWWAWLPPLVSEEVFQQINELQLKHQVLFVTSRATNPTAQLQTHDWLSNNDIYRPNVVVTNKKGEVARAVGAHYHIDDKPENAACVHWLADAVPCRSYLLVRPATKDEWVPKNVRRVTSVSEFIRDIEEDV